MTTIECPKDLNQFLLGEPLFENTFPEGECEQKKAYGDCYHCFATAIAKRDQKLRAKFTDEAKKNEEQGAESFWEEYCYNIGDNDFYRYRCANCKGDAPVNHRGSEYCPDICPKCKAKMLSKV